MTMTSTLRFLLLSLVVLTSGLLWPLGGHTQTGNTARKELMDTVLTNTTTPAFTIPSGVKAIYGAVTGTGAVTQTQALYGDINNDSANGILLCTLTLSGTTRDQAACTPFEGSYFYYYIVTTNTTGTGAAGFMYAMY